MKDRLEKSHAIGQGDQSEGYETTVRNESLTEGSETK